MKFSKFLNVIEAIYLEMPRVKADEVVPMPDELIEWLIKNFAEKPQPTDPPESIINTQYGPIQREMSKRWFQQALAWLFDHALHTSPPTDNMDGVKLTTTGRDSRNVQRVFTGVPVPLDVIQQAFGSEYDIHKLKTGTPMTAKRWANKLMDFLAGTGKKPEFNFSDARKNFQSPDEHEWSYKKSAARPDDVKGDILGRDKEEEIGDYEGSVAPGKGGESAELDRDGSLHLDDADRQFIDYFMNGTGTVIKGPRKMMGQTIPLKQFLKRAMMIRYSPTTSDNRDWQSRDKIDMIFKLPGSMAEVEAVGVPMNARHVVRRMRALHDKFGTEWATRGIPPVSADSWIKKGTIKINYHKKQHAPGFLQQADFDDGAGSAIDRYRHDWEAYAAGETAEPPTDVAPNLKIDSQVATWDELMRNEAKSATEAVFRSIRQRVGDATYRKMMSNEFDGIVNLVHAALLNNELAQRPEYAQQEWRHRQAVKVASQEIEGMVDTRSASKKRDDAAVLRTIGKPADTEAPKSSSQVSSEETPEDDDEVLPDVGDTEFAVIKGMVDKLIVQYDLDLRPGVTVSGITRQIQREIEKEGQAKAVAGGDPNLPWLAQFRIIRTELEKAAIPVSARPVTIPAAAAELIHKPKRPEVKGDDVLKDIEKAQQAAATSAARVTTGGGSWKDFLKKKREGQPLKAPEPLAPIQPPSKPFEIPIPKSKQLDIFGHEVDSTPKPEPKPAAPEAPKKKPTTMDKLIQSMEKDKKKKKKKPSGPSLFGDDPDSQTAK